jgi:hypothetical protein
MPDDRQAAISYFQMGTADAYDYVRIADLHVSLLSRVGRDVLGAFARTRSA